MNVYQSLVTVNPVTLIAQIGNLFIQLFFVKKFFLDKIKAILDQRRAAADREITAAQEAHAQAEAIKAAYVQNMNDAKEKADAILSSARHTAASRSEEILHQAQVSAAQIRTKASADIEAEKKKAIQEAKMEISGLAMAIAGKILEQELTPERQSALIDQVIRELGNEI